MEINQSIVKRFLQNKCTKLELEQLQIWYDSFENNFDGIGQMTNQEQQNLENKLYQSIKEKMAMTETLPNHSFRWQWLGTAAAILLVYLGIRTYETTFKNTQILNGGSFSTWAKYENISDKELKIVLPDGSTVLMKPKTQLAYNQSDGLFREVNLTGEAFFEVMPDVAHPFLIHTGKMTTKVLGTSFTIKSYPNMKRSEVSVVSGRVTVYEKDTQEKRNNGVILTPNLKVTFFDEEEHFVTGLVEKPEVIKVVDGEKPSFYFQNASLNEVLTALEKAYGIKMVLERESLGKCTLNGDLTEMPLFTKLDIITRSLNASYEVKGTSILVSGMGCE